MGNHRLHMHRMRARLQTRQIDKRLDFVRADDRENRPRRAQLDLHRFRVLRYPGFSRGIEHRQRNGKTAFHGWILVVHHKGPKNASRKQSDNLHRQIMKKNSL